VPGRTLQSLSGCNDWLTRPEEKIEPSDLAGVLEAISTERSRYLHGGIGEARIVADSMERADLSIAKMLGIVKRSFKRGSLYRNSKGQRRPNEREQRPEEATFLRMV